MGFQSAYDSLLGFGNWVRRWVGAGYLGVLLPHSYAGVDDCGEGRGNDDSFDCGGIFLDSFENPRSTNNSYVQSVRLGPESRRGSSTLGYLGRETPSLYR